MKRPREENAGHEDMEGDVFPSFPALHNATQELQPAWVVSQSDCIGGRLQDWTIYQSSTVD